jgi:hypothetical protein
MRRLSDPMAIAQIDWLTAAGGGRAAPPPGPVYAATAVFTIEPRPDDDQPEKSEHFSIMLDFEPDSVEAKVDFFAKDLVRDYVHSGSRFTVMEGDRAVAEGVITEVL